MATIIMTVNDLKGIANNMAGEYELGANIDLDGVNWIPIGASETQSSTPTEFTGTFDGKGYTINNLTINSNPTGEYHMIGLFAQLGNCTIRNLVINNAEITDVGYNPHVGILAGRAYYTHPTIVNVSVQGVITVTHTSSSEKGNSSVAGFVGCLYGENNAEIEVTDCISNVEIRVYGCAKSLYVAGFIGYGRKLTLTRCFAFGDITVENTADSGINVSTMQALCYYTEHIDCATAVSIYGAIANTVQTCGKYLTSTQEFTGTRNIWEGATVSYETYTDNKIVSVSQANFIALVGDSEAFNTVDADFENGEYMKLAIDTFISGSDTGDSGSGSSGSDNNGYDLTIAGRTFNGVKKVVYNGTVIKKLNLNGTEYTF